MAKLLGSLSVGDKVKFGKIYNVPIVWKISDKNHAGYPANAVSLITEKVIKCLAFDATESGGDSNRQSYGNNRYQFSNLLQWLNSAAAAGTWYTAKHTYDQSPTKARCANYNGYDNIAGFLNAFTADERAALLDTTVTVNKATVDGGGQETVTSKIFLLSYAEFGLDQQESEQAEGTRHALFTQGSGGNAGRIAMPTTECVADSDYQASGFNVGAGWYHWSRSPRVSNSSPVRVVYTDGSTNNHHAYSGIRGLRPACNLLSTYLVSDLPDGDGCYTVLYNEPPTVPGVINVPSTVAGGAQIGITWGQSTDPEGTNVTYRLERRIDTGPWTLVYSGANRTYADTAQVGVTEIRYRVKAVDGDNVESDWQTSGPIAISQKQPPSIPASINVPGQAHTGGSVLVQWGPSVDPDGGDLEYILERMVNDGEWMQIYAGENMAFSDTAPIDAETLQYRVRSKDYLNLYSIYKVSNIVSIVSNFMPTISGQDADLGAFSDSFDGYDYTIDDEDSPSVTVQEIINNSIIHRTYQPNLGEEQHLDITGIDWQKIGNGNHTIKIVATDTGGATTTRTLTFYKDVDAIELKTNKLIANAKPSGVLVNVLGQFPTGSILTVMAANNANDDDPAWENVTGSLGSKYFFDNAAKTDANWALQFHVTLLRGTAVLPCYITDVLGGFA
jgi:hypothetical protein